MIDSVDTPSRKSARLVLTLALAAVAVLAFVVRAASIAEPLGIDQSLWASAARGMARGQLLYRDVWEQRPPGIYWIYLAGFQVFGWTAATVAWLDVLAGAATTVLLYAIVRPLSTRTAALTTSAMYATLTMPAWLYGNGGFLERSVCETFIVPAAAAAALCAVRFRARPSLASACGVGLFSGAAVVLKPNAGLYFPALLVWMFLYADRSPRAQHTSAVRPAVAAFAGGAVLPAVALLWLWSGGILGEAKIAVLDFNRYYIGEGFSAAKYASDFAHAVFLRMKTDPLWLAGTVGSLSAIADLLRRRHLPPAPALALIWGTAAVLVIAVNGGRLFNSYFINAFAPLGIAGAWLLADTARETRIRRGLAVAVGILMAVLIVRRDYAGRIFESAATDLDRLRGRTSATSYLERFGRYNQRSGYSARANAELAEYLRAHTGPDERIFLFGINGAGVYFDSDRLTAHRFLRVNFFIDTDFYDERFRLGAVVHDLAERRPRYLVFERLHATSQPEVARLADSLPQQSAVATLLTGYTMETTIEDFTLFRRLD
jgi:4-amino-4-deoxy-L-arabinose transferase-like glycosyltransferase